VSGNVSAQNFINKSRDNRVIIVGGNLLLWSKWCNELCVCYAGKAGMMHVCMMVVVHVC